MDPPGFEHTADLIAKRGRELPPPPSFPQPEPLLKEKMSNFLNLLTGNYHMSSAWAWFLVSISTEDSSALNSSEAQRVAQQAAEHFSS